MPASFHKMLVHGTDIVSVAILPTGHTQEYRDKNHKYFGRSHSRKTFITSTNEDVFNLLLVSSIPFITSLRKLPKKAEKTFVPKALKTILRSERIGIFD